MAIRVARKRADSYQHGDLRPALIQAGLKLLTEGGVAGLSLRAAAQLAGVSHAAPYRHFRDKDALVQAIAEEGFRLLTRRMRLEIDGCGSTDVLVRLRASAVGYVSFALEHPGYFRTIFGRGGGDDCDVSTATDGETAETETEDAATGEHPDNHGKLVSEAAQTETPDGFDNHGALVRSVAQDNHGHSTDKAAAKAARKADH